jgi:hypothetical protein
MQMKHILSHISKMSCSLKYAPKDKIFKSSLNKTSQGWRQIGGKKIYARSIWEANYARYLEFLKKHKKIIDWEHEPKTFWFEGIKRGCVSYKPDFKVSQLDGSIIWYEVKGFYDSKSLTKKKRFEKYFPEEKLFFIDKKWFTNNNKQLSSLIPDWEKGSNRQNIYKQSKKIT